MTEEQYERLPKVFQEIVDNQQQLDELSKIEVVPFKARRDLTLRKRELIKLAGRMYQPNVKGKGDHA